MRRCRRLPGARSSAPRAAADGRRCPAAGCRSGTKPQILRPAHHEKPDRQKTDHQGQRSDRQPAEAPAAVLHRQLRDQRHRDETRPPAPPWRSRWRRRGGRQTNCSRRHRSRARTGRPKPSGRRRTADKRRAATGSATAASSPLPSPAPRGTMPRASRAGRPAGRSAARSAPPAPRPTTPPPTARRATSRTRGSAVRQRSTMSRPPAPAARNRRSTGTPRMTQP